MLLFPISVLGVDRKSTRLNSGHTEIYTLSLHDALPICMLRPVTTDGKVQDDVERLVELRGRDAAVPDQRIGRRSEEHTSELRSHRDLHSFPTRRSSDLHAPTSHHRRQGSG